MTDKVRILAAVIQPDGFAESRKIVEAELEGVAWRKPDDEECRAVLDWAHDQGVDTVAFKGGPQTLRACRACGEPVWDGPNKCEWCAYLGDLIVAGIDFNGKKHTYSRADIERRAQVVERLSVQLAETAIYLQGLAASAPEREVEVVQVPQPLSVQSVIERMLAKTRLDTATGADLDRLASLVGVSRVRAPDGPFFGSGGLEADQALRARIVSRWRQSRCVLHPTDLSCGCEE